jgi:hypothetical protein
MDGQVRTILRQKILDAQDDLPLALSVGGFPEAEIPLA